MRGWLVDCRSRRFVRNATVALVLLASNATAADPRPNPQRLIPAKGLVAYIEYDGLAAHEEAWRATAAYAMLAKTPAGSMMREVARQLIDAMLTLEPDVKLTGADLLAIEDHLAHRGFAIALYQHGDDVESWTVVLNGAGRPGARERFDRILNLLLTPTPPAKPSAPATIRDRSIHRLSDQPRVAPGNDPPRPTPPRLSWWFEKDDLVLIAVPFLGDGAPAGDRPVVDVPARQLESVLDAAEGKVPDVTRHPAHIAAMAEGTDIQGFESDGLFFIDPAGDWARLVGLIEHPFAFAAHVDPDLLPVAVPTVPPVPPSPIPDLDTVPPVPTVPADRPYSLPTVPTRPPAGEGDDPAPPAIPAKPRPPQAEQAAEPKREEDVAKLLGLDGIVRIVGRWGFHEKALLSDVRIQAPAPRRGMVGLLDQPAFDRDRLPPMPAASRSFVVGALDPAAAYDRCTALAKALDPDVGPLIAELEGAARDATGLRIREDLLAHLGPSWCIVPILSDDDERGKDETDPTTWVLVAGLKDADGFASVLDALAKRANRYLRDRERPDPGKADPPMLALERLPAPLRGYRLTSPARLVYWLNDAVQPTILVGKSSVAMAINLDRAREALASELGAGKPWRPTGELIRAFAGLPAKLTFLTVGDPRASGVPGLIAGLPGIVQMFSTTLVGSEAPSADFLTIVGVPGAGQFRLRIDPNEIPKEEDLRSRLFPSVLAAAVDDRGIRFLTREAIPMACFGDGAYLKSKVEWSRGSGLENKLKMGLKLGTGR